MNSMNSASHIHTPPRHPPPSPRHDPPMRFHAPSIADAGLSAHPSPTPQWTPSRNSISMAAWSSDNLPSGISAIWNFIFSPLQVPPNPEPTPSSSSSLICLGCNSRPWPHWSWQIASAHPRISPHGTRVLQEWGTNMTFVLHQVDGHRVIQDICARVWTFYQCISGCKRLLLGSAPLTCVRCCTKCHQVLRKVLFWYP